MVAGPYLEKSLSINNAYFSFYGSVVRKLVNVRLSSYFYNVFSLLTLTSFTNIFSFLTVFLALNRKKSIISWGHVIVNSKRTLKFHDAGGYGSTSLALTTRGVTSTAVLCLYTLRNSNAASLRYNPVSQAFFSHIVRNSVYENTVRVFIKSMKLLHIFLKSTVKKKLRWELLTYPLKMNTQFIFFHKKSYRRIGLSKGGSKLFRRKTSFPNKTFTSIDVNRV